MKHGYQFSVIKPFSDPIENKTVTKCKKTENKSQDCKESIIECAFNLPWCLTDEYIGRHELSKHDWLDEILNNVPTKYLWLVGLKFGLEIPISATHISANQRNKCCFRNSSLILAKLKNTVIANRNFESDNGINDNGQFAAANKLICPFDNFQPNLPVHFINLNQFKMLVAMVDIVKTTTEDKYFENLFRFKDVDVLPLYFYHGYILCARVFPKLVYQSIYGKPKSALDTSNEYVVNGEVYCETDERFLVTVLDYHNEIIKFARFSKEYFLKCYTNDVFTFENHETKQKELGLLKKSKLQNKNLLNENDINSKNSNSNTVNNLTEDIPNNIQTKSTNKNKLLSNNDTTIVQIPKTRRTKIKN